MGQPFWSTLERHPAPPSSQTNLRAVLSLPLFPIFPTLKFSPPYTGDPRTSKMPESHRSQIGLSASRSSSSHYLVAQGQQKTEFRGHVVPKWASLKNQLGLVLRQNQLKPASLHPL